MSQIDNVNIVTKSNVYFDGKCISHWVLSSDGTRRTVGVIFPSTLKFTTAAPERMDITDGRCRVRLDGQSDWSTYGPGDSFHIPGDSSFDIEALDMVDYVCTFGAVPESIS